VYSTHTTMETDSLITERLDERPSTAFFSPIRRVLFVALVSAASFAFTQTSLIYAFRVMTCDDYYNHPPHSHHLSHSSDAGPDIGYGLVDGGKDRCSIPVIEGRTARAIAIMSTMTTFCCTSSISPLLTPLNTLITQITTTPLHQICAMGGRANQQQS
jgi:hypothetical protein